MSIASDDIDRLDPSRVRRLKFATRTCHAQVDELVMAFRPFESAYRYSKFLTVQHRFRGALHSTYIDPEMNAWLPDLAAMGRLHEVEADMKDLGMRIPSRPSPATISSPWHALGWLYCSEGSNLGAAFLMKMAAGLQLGSEHGARHLSAHPQGRGAHWRAFINLVDELELTREEDLKAEDGAREAFDFYRRQLNDCLGAIG